VIPFDVTTSVRPSGLRGKTGHLLQKLFPDVDRRAYARARKADMRARRKTGLNALSKRRYPAAFSRREIYDTDRETHVVVVPAEGINSGTWAVAAGNFYFEVAGNLESHIGSDRVSVLHVDPQEPCSTWHRELFDHLMDAKATHLIAHVEHDPGSSNQTWTWDSFWNDLSPRWGGVFLGSTFDASYRFTSAKARFLARISPRFMAIDVGLPIAGTLSRKRFEVGPVNRPMSPATLQAIRQRLTGVVPTVDVAFVGALYPYRIELIKQLEALGLSIAVNPHKENHYARGDSEGGGQPGWLDYLAGLRSGRITINFSRSSAGPVEQLKWRAIEAGLAGTYFVTDDQHRTRLFWPDDQFSTFSTIEDLSFVLEETLSDQRSLLDSTAAFSDRAYLLARNHYWGAVEDGLRKRGLPGLGVTPFAI